MHIYVILPWPAGLQISLESIVYVYSGDSPLVCWPPRLHSELPGLTPSTRLHSDLTGRTGALDGHFELPGSVPSSQVELDPWTAIRNSQAPFRTPRSKRKSGRPFGAPRLHSKLPVQNGTLDCHLEFRPKVRGVQAYGGCSMYAIAL